MEARSLSVVTEWQTLSDFGWRKTSAADRSYEQYSDAAGYGYYTWSLTDFQDGIYVVRARVQVSTCLVYSPFIRHDSMSLAEPPNPNDILSKSWLIFTCTL